MEQVEAVSCRVTSAEGAAFHLEVRKLWASTEVEISAGNDFALKITFSTGLPYLSHCNVELDKLITLVHFGSLENQGYILEVIPKQDGV